MCLNIGEEASEGEVEEGNKGKGKRNMLWAHDPVSWRQGLYKVGVFFPPIEYSGVLYVKEGLCIL